MITKAVITSKKTLFIYLSLFAKLGLRWPAQMPGHRG
jgi:hypothetical protein